MRFQFNLRTLFAVVTIAAVACAWLGHEYHVVQERNAMRERIEYVEGRLGDEDYKNYSNADEPSLIQHLDQLAELPQRVRPAIVSMRIRSYCLSVAGRAGDLT